LLFDTHHNAPSHAQVVLRVGGGVGQLGV
jgi:hypothetical protein